MTSETLAFALAAGTLAAVNPCGFAMLPAYLSLFVAAGPGEARRSTVAAVGRALAATGSMTLGFVAVFGVFGLALTPVASTVQRWLPVATVVIGMVLFVMGLLLLAGRNLTLHVPFLRLSKDPVASPLAMALYGVSYAVASLGCTIGPFLVVTATTFRAGNTLNGVAAYATYALGMGLVVGVLAIGAALMSNTAAGILRRLTPYLTRLSGVLLVVAGGYVGWYGWYELRVYAGDATDDPVVSTASDIQSRIAAWVDQLGVPVFAAALALLIASAFAGRFITSRRDSKSRSARAADLLE
ncbi:MULTISPECIES: cytochrome c biogenesis CcdA family protein [unclassified Nocardioides]|uniref:cytochrome c biogenesis CcdA family protein n=1 Tax=unclassified Nocardioides TaxID=2615069 RepID=UPI0000571AAD|nr:MULTISPECIES: cytochrome c biogenesis CcdA family protein [unclassified Nocardioides]ABL79531.1 cytochrome c biogenesis protein, transmembrane region [Nocardioides sp. JS614]